MDISKFKIEFWLNPYDDKAKHNLGSSCCKPVTVSELLTSAGGEVIPGSVYYKR